MEKFWEVKKLPTLESGLFPVPGEVLNFVENCLACTLEKEKEQK